MMLIQTDLHYSSTFFTMIYREQMFCEKRVMQLEKCYRSIIAIMQISFQETVIILDHPAELDSLSIDTSNIANSYICIYYTEIRNYSSRLTVTIGGMHRFSRDQRTIQIISIFAFSYHNIILTIIPTAVMKLELFLEIQCKPWTMGYLTISGLERMSCEKE